MELYISKKQKFAFALFVTVAISVILCGLRASAEIDWASLSPKVGKLTVERNPFLDFIYLAEYNVLKVFCELIDMFDSAVKELINMNLYQMAKDSLNIESTIYDVAGIVAGAAMCLAAAVFMATAEKSHLTDFVRGILVCILLFAGLPTIISAASNLRAAGVDEFENAGSNGVTVDDDMKVSVETLGEKILASNIYVVGDSLRNNTLYTYADTTDYASNYGAVYNIDPRDTLPNDEFNAIIRESRPVQYYQTSYSEFSTYDKLQLLDSNITNYATAGRNTDSMSTLYAAWENTYDETYFEEIGDLIYVRSGGGFKTPQREYFYVTYTHEGSDEYQIQAHETGEKAYPHRWQIDNESYSVDENGNRIYGKEEVGVEAINAFNYNKHLINRFTSTLSSVSGVWGEMKANFTADDAYNLITNCTTFEEAISAIENKRYPIEVGKNYVDMNIFEYLVYKQNLQNVRDKIEDDEVVGGLNYDEFTVITDEDYANLPETEKIYRKILGIETQKMYAYNIRFGYGFILSIVTLICLIFAGVKVASLLFDLYFAEVVAPIAIASDMNAGGRAKQVIMNILSCNLCFIAVVLILRLYITVMLKAYETVDNVLVVLFLAAAGAKFTIDGPDLIVKLTGMDAGVKSGLSTIMGVRTATQMAGGAGRIAAGVSSKAAGAASGMTAGAVSGFANGKGIGRFGGAILGGASGVSSGSKAGGLFGGMGAGAAGGKAIGDASGKDKFAAAFGNTAAGQEFKQSAGNQERTNAQYSESRGNPSNSGSSSAAPAKDGKDGKDGRDGIKGADGKNGENAQSQNNSSRESSAAAPKSNSSNAASNSSDSKNFGGSAEHTSHPNDQTSENKYSDNGSSTAGGGSAGNAASSNSSTVGKSTSHSPAPSSAPAPSTQTAANLFNRSAPAPKRNDKSLK